MIKDNQGMTLDDFYDLAAPNQFEDALSVVALELIKLRILLEKYIEEQ